MLDLFNLPTPQGCNIQTFYKDGAWLKPRGASNIYMLCIGGGGNGNGVNGGGSGTVCVWYGSAQNVPDSLIVVVSVGTSSNSSIRGRFANSATEGTNLMNAPGGSAGTGGAVMTANQFTASGFFQSIAGQNGTNSTITASTTTFLSGGGGFAQANTSNYGYSSGPGSTNRNGFFQTQPIIVGTSGMGTGRGNIGCGGGMDSGVGGPGFVLIASW
jgi:hypothetical protein